MYVCHKNAIRPDGLNLYFILKQYRETYKARLFSGTLFKILTSVALNAGIFAPKSGVGGRKGFIYEFFPSIF